MIPPNAYNFPSIAAARANIDARGHVTESAGQHIRFSCTRCGIPADDLAPAVPYSGFLILYEKYRKDQPGGLSPEYWVAITRQGAAEAGEDAGSSDGGRYLDEIR